MTMKSNAAGLAALSNCESLFLSLTDLKIIDDGEAVSILKDASAAPSPRRRTPRRTNLPPT